MTAEALIAAVEALPLGEPYAEPCAAAERAARAARAAAAALLFPSAIMPAPADALSAFVFHTQRLTAAGYEAGLAEIHRRALASFPALAALCRGADALDDLAAAAASCAVPASHLETHAVAGARAAAAARARYEATIARQLHEHELAPAARDLLEAERLAARLVAARGRHEAHAAAELARAEEERKAAARDGIRAIIARTVEAERKLAADRAQAELSAEECRATKAAALVERLKLSGLERLRLADGALFSVADVIASAPRMSTEQIDHYAAALAAHEARL